MPKAGLFAIRSYAGSRTAGGGKFNRIELFDVEDRRLLAVMACEPISGLRTAAATAVAAQYLANADADTLAIIGAGQQARLQVRGLAASRSLKAVRVWSRSQERREAFAAQMQAELGIAVEACASAEQCVSNAALVLAATKSAQPVIERRWLAPGAHVTGMGANAADRRELDDQTILDAAVVCVDDPDQARIEAGEFIDLVAAGRLSWSTVRSLSDIVRSEHPARRSTTDLTVFKSLGIGIEDLALAAVVYRRALDRGVGSHHPDV
jgi:ornithine cyclodeaminase/alanine dehydrogenase-like protein (mu-crystallin family)